MNALRALLYENGHVFPQGIRSLNRITALVEDKTDDLQPLIREECLDLLAQIAEKPVRIIERTAKLKTLAAESDSARRLQTMTGVGPLTAIAVEALDLIWRSSKRDVTLRLGWVWYPSNIHPETRNVWGG